MKTAALTEGQVETYDLIVVGAGVLCLLNGRNNAKKGDFFH